MFSFGFSNNIVNEEIKTDKIVFIEKTVNLNDEINSIENNEIIAPCTLTVTVKVKIKSIGGSESSAEVTGSLHLQDCRDIGEVGAGFISGLISEAIRKATK